MFRIFVRIMVHKESRPNNQKLAESYFLIAYKSLKWIQVMEGILANCENWGWNIQNSETKQCLPAAKFQIDWRINVYFTKRPFFLVILTLLRRGQPDVLCECPLGFIFYRQVCCLLFSLRFCPKIKQFNSLRFDFFFKNR